MSSKRCFFPTFKAFSWKEEEKLIAIPLIYSLLPIVEFVGGHILKNNQKNSEFLELTSVPQVGAEHHLHMI